MQNKKSLLDVTLRVLSAIYKLLGSFSYKVMEIEGVRLHSEIFQQAIPAWKATDKFYGLRSRNKHHSVTVCIVKPLSAMICISSRDPLNCSALYLQQLGRSYLYIFNPAVHWPVKCVQGTISPSRYERKEVRPQGFTESLADAMYVKHVEYQPINKFC